MINLNNITTEKEFRLYSLQEVAKILGVTERSLLTYIKTGRLRAQKIGGRWRVSYENLKAFINGSDQ